MSSRHYPLAPSVWGNAVELPVQSLVQGALFAEFGGLRGVAFVDVALEPNPLSGTWRVRRLGGSTAGPIIGEIAAERRAQYPDIRRVDASLLRPVTTAAVELDRASGRFRASVLLPPPPLAVPRNDTPASAIVLPPGDMMVVDTAAGEYTASELRALSPGQWFVALHRVGSTVAATLGERVLGGFSLDDATELTTFLHETHPTPEHTPDARPDTAPGVYALAVLLDGMAALNVAGPWEGAREVPRLKVPFTRPLSPWQTIDFPDGTWGVTVERDYVMDPGTEPKPKHTARYVSLEGVARPESVAAPTEVFQRVDIPDDDLPRPGAETTGAEVGGGASALSGSLSGAGEYLTEVEKVRMRRRARVAGEAGVGKHRK